MHKRLFLLVGLGLAAGIGLPRLPRPEGLFQRAAQDDAEVAAVRRRVGMLAAELESSRADVERMRRRQERFGELGAVLQSLEQQLSATRDELARERERADAEAAARATAEEDLTRRITALDAGLETRWTDLQRAVLETHSLAEAASGSLDEFRRDASPDRDRMWNELMGPTVQLAGESTVGSGVLLPSKRGDDGRYTTHLLTAWHVVRDILADADGLERPIPVTLYQQDGGERHRTATLLEFDPTLDVALLSMNGDEAYRYGAQLPSPQRLAECGVFDPIYAVGCPLGNDPIPTYGEIADTAHEVNDESYWMISAPTYIGNSGGGIFDARTHELLGIFSKIYTHGNLRPTVVPHMGLVTPMDRISTWLVEVGHGAVLEPGAPQPRAAGANR